MGDWQGAPPQVLMEYHWPSRTGLQPVLSLGWDATCQLANGRSSCIEDFIVSSQLVPLVVVHPQYTAPWVPHIGLELDIAAQWALFLPKLQSYFAELLKEGSPALLGILYLPTCVGLRYR